MGEPGRPSASQRGYDATWRKLREAILAEEPTCRYCDELGITTPAQHVDHIIPLHRRPDLRLERTNLQPLCADCHNSVKAKEESRGTRMGCDVNGLPLGGHWHDD